MKMATMADFRWSDDKVERLISAVRKYECLYVVQAKSYRDLSYAKENCWQAVATEVAADVTGELHIFI